MIKYKKGDLIKAAKKGEVDVIIHQCNCFNNMGAGIAPQIAKAFPNAKLIDEATKKGDASKLGTFTIDKSSDVWVVNLYGQFGWWKRKDGKINTEYDKLEQGFKSLSSLLLIERPNVTIGLPKIGCGLGGGSWNTVAKIIEKTLSNFTVVVYEL